MLADLFWRFATSDIAIAIVGAVAVAAIAVAAIVVSHVPLIRWIPTIDHWMKLATAIGYVALLLLGLQVGHRLSDERAETRRLQGELQWSKNQLEQQEASARHAEQLARDAAAEAAQLQEKVTSYEEALAKIPAGACALDDTDIERLRGIVR